MAAERSNFEVQVMKDGRWIQQLLVGDEAGAVSAAKRCLNDKKCEGARVIHNWARADGKFIEKEIFSETRAIRDDGPIRIVQIDDPPPQCETVDDFYGPQSRAAANRLLRNYMEKTFVTPTELMHNYKEMKRLEDKDALLPSAVDRVAFLQTKETEVDSKSRREEIFKSLNEMSAKARRADGMNLPKLNGSFKDMYDHVSDMAVEPNEADFLAMVVLSRDLVNVRNWVGKLDRLCRLAVDSGDSHSLNLLDGVIADVLGSAVVQEVLGFQPSLAAAICAMFDLAEGNFKFEKSDAGESAEMLNQLFSQKKLPQSRLVMIDRAHKQLASPNPLNRNDPTREREALEMVINRALTPTGLCYGPQTAQALTDRFCKIVTEGGAAGRRAAITSTIAALPDMAYGTIYLCNLFETSYAPEHTPDIIGSFERVLNCRGLSRLCDRMLKPKEKMFRATAAHRAVSASKFPEGLKTKILNHIDSVLERYLLEEQVIEKLDNPDSLLRDRAVRLVQFCAAGVLPEGKAMKRARERILHMLRQPNFDLHFIEGITESEKAQKSLRDFHILLVRAGFGG